ncbi:F18 fimbrial protein FedE [Escherichia albertii]|nr:F18 fimbrial protein FedE [Escherichia albertii]MCU7297542.1 F18 fimbrial protein FedE [Escherichia albertii]MCU7306864.1 F18 fimbrial protein FedE [Escherichia albertii]
MTGAEFRAMRFTKATLAALMMMMTGSGQAITTATLTINVTFAKPSCDIQVPSSYNLGSLKLGVRHHEDLRITWNCGSNTPVKTALTAAIVRGNPKGNEEVTLLADGGRASDVTLSLKEKSGSRIKLTGESYFCGDTKEVTGMRSCTLTPVTNVSVRQSWLGEVSATLRFEVGYL